MLLATNKYTKLFDYLKDTNKTYEFEALFGYESDSFDIDTDVRKVDSINLNLLQNELQKGINSLTGKIKQSSTTNFHRIIKWQVVFYHRETEIF